MSNVLESKLYKQDIKRIIESDFLDFTKLKNSSIMISGASGMIGSCIIDVLMELNSINKEFNCKIFAIGRNEERAKDRFNKYWDNDLFSFIICDVNERITLNDNYKIDYILHLASNTHPKAYATKPIETIVTNIIGTKNLLDFASENNIKRFVFTSSCEIYGENKGDTEKFLEDYCGYINCNTMRAGYPESKRCGEALCQAYISQKNMNIVIPRLPRIYGPTMLMEDSKALSQFIKNGINGEDIILKSDGMQYYSYLYVADAASGILKIMLDGKNGEVYNVASDESDIRLKDLSKIIAEYVGTQVRFELPDEVEKAGFSKATKALLNSNKIEDIGWKANYTIKEGIENTIKILKEI